jgi:hypothetical protein
LRISGEQRLDGLDGCSGKCRENEFLWLVEGDARKPREIEAAGIFDRPAKGRLGGKPRDGEWRAAGSAGIKEDILYALTGAKSL